MAEPTAWILEVDHLPGVEFERNDTQDFLNLSGSDTMICH